MQLKTLLLAIFLSSLAVANPIVEPETEKEVYDSLWAADGSLDETQLRKRWTDGWWIKGYLDTGCQGTEIFSYSDHGAKGCTRILASGGVKSIAITSTKGRGGGARYKIEVTDDAGCGTFHRSIDNWGKPADHWDCWNNPEQWGPSKPFVAFRVEDHW